MNYTSQYQFILECKEFMSQFLSSMHEASSGSWWRMWPPDGHKEISKLQNVTKDFGTLMLNTYKVLVRNTEGRRPLRKSRNQWEKNIKWTLRKQGERIWSGFIWLGTGTTVVGSCEHGSRSSASRRGESSVISFPRSICFVELVLIQLAAQ